MSTAHGHIPWLAARALSGPPPWTSPVSDYPVFVEALVVEMRVSPGQQSPRLQQES